MTNDLITWTHFLEGATDFTKDRSFLYEVQLKNEKSKYLSLTKKGFDDFNSNPSKIYCEKLTLDKILKISKSLFIANITILDIQFRKFIMLDNIFSMTDQEIENKLEDLRSSYNYLDKIPTALRKMADRSLKKRTVDKTKGIWHRIKCFFLAWFFHKVDLERNVLIQSLKVDPKSLMKTVINNTFRLIKERILTNMKGFADEIKDSSFDDDKMASSLKVPNDVKKLWLLKYAEDKYLVKVSNQADIHRKRIIQVMKIWEFIKAYQIKNKFI